MTPGVAACLGAGPLAHSCIRSPAMLLVLLLLGGHVDAWVAVTLAWAFERASCSESPRLWGFLPSSYGGGSGVAACRGNGG